MANAKGAVLLGPIKFLRKRRDAARELLPAALHHYLEQEIRLSSWYPETDFVELVRASAQLMPGEIDVAIEQMGVVGAQALAEVYGDLMRSMKSNSSVFALWTAQHDTGELRGSWESPTSARVELAGFAAPSRENCLLANGYIRGSFALNGHDDVAVEKRSCVVLGADRCAWRVTWKPRK